jgi:hypothetical protein
VILRIPVRSRRGGCQQSVFVAHVALDVATVGDRSTWYSVEDLKDRPQTNLKLFIGEGGQFLHFAINLTGKPTEPGYVLPKFNMKEHTVTAQPWGVERVATFQPKQPGSNLCFAWVEVGYCVYIPEFATPSECLEKIAA